MGQMYKVFINQKPVIFVNKDQFDHDLINKKNVLVLDNAKLSAKSLALIMLARPSELYVVAKNIGPIWKQFVKKFKVIKAGGGLVFNKKNELLFIYRKKKWDLPKGKLDKGETIEKCAVREVKEECGIKTLTLATRVCDTFHIYELKNKPVLKKTTWFLMHMNKHQKLTPQIDEDISDLRFFSKKDYSKKVKRNTYPLIADLIENMPEQF